MPIPTNTLTLAWKLPDDDTPIDGTWLIWLETAHGLAIDDAGNGIGGKLHLPTTSGTVTVDLPDTTDADYSPQNAWYKASFTSTDRRVRVKSEPFVMDEDKTVEDIFTVGNLPVTPSDAALAQGYRNDAEGFADDAADSAASAGLAATAASGAATTATTQAGSAATSATAAASSATAAAGSASTAGTNASNAATSATNAASSASAASTSAAAASGSAATAATQATNAGTSATNAATSATNAASSATSAAASAATALAAQHQVDVFVIRDWFRNGGAVPPRGTDSPVLWVIPQSFMSDLDTHVPERLTGDEYDGVQGV